MSETKIARDIHKELLYECKKTAINYNRILYLIELKADINIKDEEGKTPLIIVVIKNNLSIVKLLLINKVLVDVKDNLGQTAFFYACEYKHLEIAKTISNTHADLNLSNHFLISPFQIACIKGNFSIISFLSKIKQKEDFIQSHDSIVSTISTLKKKYDEYRIDFNTQDIKGNHCCHSLVEKSFEGILNIIFHILDFDNKQVVKLDLKNEKGETPFFLACKLGHSKIVRLFINKKIDYNSKNKEGKTPCYIAAENGHSNVISELSYIPIDTDIPETKYGQTPLFEACKQGHIQTCNELVRSGSNVHLATPKKTGSFTPFFISIFNKHFDISKLLILKGYVPKKKDFYNKNRIMACLELNHWCDERLIKKKGIDKELYIYIKKIIKDIQDAYNI